MNSELRRALKRGVILTACVLPLAYLAGLSLEDVGLGIALGLAAFYAWRGK